MVVSMHSHAGAWERDKKENIPFRVFCVFSGLKRFSLLVPTLPRGNAYGA
jgi:hypothetical protein